jgi:ATP-binding cassette subfamily C protein
MKLLLVTVLSFIQSIFSVLGVTSVFPFLALAADTDRLRNSRLGRLILDFLPPMNDLQLLIWAGGFAVFMLFFANGITMIAEYARIKYAHNYGHWLRMKLLQKITARPYSVFLKTNTGIFVKKIVADVGMFVNVILLLLLESMTRLLTIIMLIATIYFIHPQIALFIGGGLGLYYAVIFWFLNSRRKHISNELLVSHRGVFVHTQQLLSGIKVVKIHLTEESFIKKVEIFSHRYAKAHPWITIYGNIPRYLIESIAFGAIIVVIVYNAGIGQNLAAILPNLGVMAFAGYKVLPSLQLLYSQLTQVEGTMASLNEVYDEFLAAEQEHQEDKTKTDLFPKPKRLQWSRSITLENLTYKYSDRDKPVIQNLLLVIPKNTSLGIVGPTGCGKSTLVDLIIGLHTPTSGRILIDDIPLSKENCRAWRAGIGYVPQDIFLTDDTVAANIAFGIPEDQVDPQNLRQAAASAQILEFIEKELPQGFQTIVGERGVRLSGGQRQRIGLARALYHKPDLLILDEATSALDIQTEAEVMKAINALHGNTTMIIIAHRLSTVSNCDNILNWADFKTTE